MKESPAKPAACALKGRPFSDRLGFALAGLQTVARRERSFRTQGALALAAAITVGILEPGFVWAALVTIAIVLVLALEALNAALEYLIDRVHPEIAEEMGMPRMRRQAPFSSEASVPLPSAP